MVESGASKFKFVSPGIQVAEIDNSRLPGIRRGTGPVVIGRTERGPALRPVSISSFSEFVEIFGNPIAGGNGGDIWRDGNRLAPTYGAYAAQAWLKNNNNLTFVRLLGSAHQDASSTGDAGWTIGSSHNATLSTGGSFGLFVIDSGSISSNLTGTLAAIFYMSEGAIELSGTTRDGAQATGTAVLIASQGTDKEFKALIKNSAGTITDTVSFNFNNTSKKYVRSVFNTNPTLLNSSITNTSQLKKYILGETFDRNIADKVSGSSAGGQWGVILSLQSGTIDQNDQSMNATQSRTGWFISQDLSSASGSYNPSLMTKLFRLKAHDSGEWEQKNLKVSVADIKASTNQDDPYGSFSIVVRRTQDSDNSVQVVERFTGCTLNPFSPSYIGKKIGDKFMQWDDTERRFREFGNYPNNSKYFYVETNSDVEAGATNPEFLPFGFLGPVHFKGYTVISGAADAQTLGQPGTNFAGVFAQGNADIVNSKANASLFVNVGTATFTGSFQFRTLPLRTTSRQGNISNPKEAYFGIDSGRNGSIRFDKSYADAVRKLPEDLSDDPDNNLSLEYMFVFSLDDVGRLGSVDGQWASGSRAGGTSFTAMTGTYSSVLSAGFDRFTSPLFGGFDGLDITEKEPFNNRVLSGQTQTTSYEFNSLKRAIDSIADPEVIECNLLAAPGITNTGITDHLLNIAENRRDTLSVIDIEGGYVPPTENTAGDSATSNRGDVDTTVSSLKARAINSSYGTTYYPWVQIRDQESGASVWVPPSIVGLGVMANTERKADLWIAPAGFTRGGLTDGAAGIPVVGVKQRLTSPERDKLYEANINPIATFPAEGIVVFGQKTLQTTPSATDRINVRRLLNHVKVEISKLAATLLFEPNLQTTWDRFKNQADTFLNSVKARFGLEDFRVILDESTTTADLRDRNIMYAKVYLKPARAIEFIGIDFVITNSGASFAD